MKLGLLMYYDDNMKEFADLNYNINKIYCNKHNITLIKEHDYTYKNRHPAWEALPYILKHISNYDYLIYIDSDAFFYEDSLDIREIINKHSDKNIIFSRDIRNYSENIIYDINTGIIIIKNCKYSIDFINFWAYNEQYYEENNEWFRLQGVVIKLYNDNKYNIKENSIIIDYGILQSFDLETKNPKPYILHLAGNTFETRIKTSSEYYNKIDL